MPFSPSVTSGLICQAIPHDFGLNDGDSIVTFDNAISGQNDGSQATSGNRATYRANQQGGKGAADFDGTNDSYSFSTLLNGLTEGEVFIILKNDTSSDMRLWENAGTGGWYPFGGATIYEDWGHSGRESYSIPASLSSTFRLHNISSKSNEWKVRDDTVQQFSITSSFTPAFPADWKIGLGGATYFDGKILAVLVYNRVLNSTERSSIVSDLANYFQMTNIGYTPPDSTAPSDVTNLTATKISDIRIDLDSDTATDNIAVTGYQTQVSSDGGSSWNTLTATTKAISFVAGDTHYPVSSGTYSLTFRRKAFDAAGNYSANWSSSPAAVSITISPPSDVSGLTGSAASPTQINLDWSDASAGSFSLSDYRVYYNTSNSHSGESTSDVGSTTSAKNITGLSVGQDYYFWVRAKDVNGNFSANFSSLLQKSTPPRIDTVSLNTAYVGVAFSQTLSKTSAQSGTWSIQSGAPSGFSINSTTGEITWASPTPAGTINNIVIRFTNTGSGLYDEETYSLLVVDITFDLEGTATYPTFQTNEANGRGVVRFSGTSNPLTNTETFSFRHLFIVCKYAGGSTFANASGLVTGLSAKPLLVGSNGAAVFQNVASAITSVTWEAKVNGVSVATSAIPIPLTYKLIELRTSDSVELVGISIGKDQSGGAKWNGDICEIIFTEDALLESEVWEIEENLIRKWGCS